MTLARRARVTFAAINSRSTAAVERRSCHSAIGNWVNRARLRAKARVDCARGPSVPSMLTGRPSTKAAAWRSARQYEKPRGISGEILAGDLLDAGGEPPVRVA